MKKLGVVSLVLGMMLASILCVGCESSDDDITLSDTGSGSTTVRGILDSVSGDYVPAAVQGITVDLVQNGKTVLRTMTEANGRFVFYNVPAGAFTLIFHIQGSEVEATLSVPESGNVVLGKVFVSPVGKVEKIEEEEAEIVVEVVVAASDPTPVTQPPADPPLDPPTISVANWWGFVWQLQQAPMLTLTQDADGKLTGDLRSPINGSIEYTVTGTVSGTTVNLVFTPTVQIQGTVISTATGTASVNQPRTAVSKGAPLPAAQSMSGTWKGTNGETGTWHAYIT